MGYDLPLIDNAWHVFASFVIFVFGLFVAYAYGKKLKVSTRYSCILYLYHTLFCIFYLNMVNNSGGDALNYYIRSTEALYDFRPGTIAIIYFSAAINYFGVGPLGMSLIYNIFGYLGVVFFYASVIKVVSYPSNTALILIKLLFLLPSMHFWTSGIGKDSLFFFSVGLLVYSAIDINKNIISICFIIVLMMLIRPHMAGVLIISLSFSLMISRGTSLYFRASFFVLSLLLTSLIVPFGLKYAGVEGGVSGVDSYIQERETKNTSGGSSIDLTSMSPPEKFFSYLFRPLPYEVNGVSQFLASIDNMILMLIFIYALYCKIRYKINNLNFHSSILWFYALGSLFILSFTSANLGIAVRQKWMFIPVFIFISMFYILNRKKSTNL
ncbi:hypothetical protein ACU440_002895 [Vibrio alginolyticus]|uniref:hypothetical protein n=1 Tax=Vibrio TaxID=662 RepID=UPI001482B790|nr:MULTISPECIES: hypothetical protein [Vibrio]MCA2450202.1 hypothetical protein [Vibrio alginolyticus]MCA2473668.1 hypothetical protein [Vibrio alginolyticus]MDW2153695.1 hypothetical protein [Vibrio sp. 2092]MDW2230207.1 hypothetical protein [Vibrio sp. 2091]NNN51846.1 hypothetical protein [Vibrio sp. 2-2(7)]